MQIRTPEIPYFVSYYLLLFNNADLTGHISIDNNGQTAKQNMVYYTQILCRKFWDENLSEKRPGTRPKSRFEVAKGKSSDFGPPCIL